VLSPASFPFAPAAHPGAAPRHNDICKNRLVLRIADGRREAADVLGSGFGRFVLHAE